MFRCCSGSEMWFYFISNQINWLQRVSTKKKFWLRFPTSEVLLPRDHSRGCEVRQCRPGHHSVPCTAAAKAVMSTSSSSLSTSGSIWVTSASCSSAAGSSVTLWASKHRYANVSSLDTSCCHWWAFWRLYFFVEFRLDKRRTTGGKHPISVTISSLRISLRAVTHSRYVWTYALTATSHLTSHRPLHLIQAVCRLAVGWVCLNLGD